LKKSAKAFAPAAISSFFEICDLTTGGQTIEDLSQVGARGGGFGLQKGVLTEVTVKEAKESKVSVFINGKPAPEAQTTLTTLKMLLEKTKGTYEVVAKHTIEIPIGAGFGTSAGGALTAALALKESLGLPLTINQLGKVAHIAEIRCQTGLGTVSSLAQCGGCALVVEPGAPGTCVIDRIPLTPIYVVVAGIFQSVTKKAIFSSVEKKREVNRFGRKTLDKILAEPTLENFLGCCWQFAQDAGFATDRVMRLVSLAKQAGAIGAAQNMVGEAVHAVTLEGNASGVVEAFKQVLPKEGILVSKIDFEGARLVNSV
jgi:pantoate kinase